MSQPLLKDKVLVKIGDKLFKCEVYAKSHKGFFLKDDLLTTKQPKEYLFIDECNTWYRNIAQARKMIAHPIVQTNKDVWDIIVDFEGRE